MGDSDLDSDSWDNTMSLRFLVDTGVFAAAAAAGASSDAATDASADAATDASADDATDAIAEGCLEFPFFFFIV